MPRLHVAVLDEELPYPLTSGKRIRTFNLLTQLSKTHRVTYIAHRNPDEEEVRAAAKALREHDIFPIVVDHQIPPKAGVGFYGRLFMNLLSPLPYSVTSHASKPLAAAARQLFEKDRPDLWHCEWTPYAQTMFGKSAPWVVMAHNVESLIWQRYVENETNPLKHWFFEKQWKRFERFEKWAYSAATRTIAVSREDADRIEAKFGGKNVAVVDNGVDTAYFRQDETVERDPRKLLFLGSLDWRPNLDAVRLLLDGIFPRVQAAEPRATLAIVGRKPPESLRSEIAKRPGVELHADVPDVRPYLHSTGMLVVPLRIGGGSRLKILEALAAGTPVVTTTIGVEGLRLRSGEHCTVADGVDAFSAAVVESIRQPKTAQLLASCGRVRVRSEYDWSGLSGKLEQVWQEAATVDSRAHAIESLKDAMPISVACPLCKSPVRLPDAAAGKKLRCPLCKGVITVKGGKAPAPMIKPGEMDAGLTDAPFDPAASAPIDEPMPISSLAKKAMQDEFNPFDDGSAHDEEEEKPGKKRYWQPKENYNPFAEPQATDATGGANPEELFDFGREDAPPSAPPSTEFDFGSSS